MVIGKMINLKAKDFLAFGKIYREFNYSEKILLSLQLLNNLFGYYFNIIKLIKLSY